MRVVSISIWTIFIVLVVLFITKTGTRLDGLSLVICLGPGQRTRKVIRPEELYSVIITGNGRNTEKSNLVSYLTFLSQSFKILGQEQLIRWGKMYFQTKEYKSNRVCSADATAAMLEV